MGLFSFVKEAGSKMFDSSDDNNDLINSDTATQERLSAVKKMKLEDAVVSSGLEVKDFLVVVNDDQVVISGNVDSQATCEKITLIAGNQQGIAEVDCQLEIVPSDAGEVADLDAGAVIVEAQAQFYSVKEGDTLGEIAKNLLGSASDYMKIFEANKPMLSDPDRIYVGQSLRIPVA